MTTEPNTIADTTRTKRETIEGPSTKAAATTTISNEERFSKRLLTPLTANPPAVDGYPKIRADTIFKVGHDFNLLAPLTSFWRNISDQFVREHIHDTDKDAAADTPSPPVPKRPLKASRDDTLTPHLADPDGAVLANDRQFSQQSLINNDDDNDDEPHLDPDLVRRAHNVRGIPYGKPQNTPSEDTNLGVLRNKRGQKR
jgi:hypothetical protein